MQAHPPDGTSESWLPVKAVIIACRPTLGTRIGGGTDDVGDFIAEYVVSYVYQVRDKQYSGTYKAGSIPEAGQTFEILYEVKNPANNTGDVLATSFWMRAAVWIGGCALTALIIWLQRHFSLNDLP